MKPETAVGLFVLAALGIFFYLSFYIGAFRLRRGDYHTHTLLFNDIAGLAKKADVTIAGVKVGWVDEISLVPEQQVHMRIMINAACILHADAYGVIRQEGLLGTKYLELNPGNPLSAILPNGSMLTQPNIATPSLDHLLMSANTIATQINDLSSSYTIKNHATPNLGEVITAIGTAAQNLAACTQRIDTLIEHNQSMLENTLSNVNTIMQELKTHIPQLSATLNTLAEILRAQTLPCIQQTAENINRVAKAVDEGKGTIGKLLHDENVYDTMVNTVQSAQECIERVRNVGIMVDAFVEPMLGHFEHHHFNDVKGYCNVWFFPHPNYFFLAGLVSTLSGHVRRYETERHWFDAATCCELIPNNMNLSNADQFKFANRTTKAIRKFDSLLLNLQVGALFRTMGIRFGIFESALGLGIDIDIPFTDTCHWLSTLEIFDFHGRNRFNDDRPHLVWLNRLFLTPNFYLTLGVDDFVSKHNKNAFIGAGLRFGTF